MGEDGVEAIKAAWRGLRVAIAAYSLTTGNDEGDGAVDYVAKAYDRGRIEAYVDILRVSTGRSEASIIDTATKRAKEDGLLK